MIYQLLVKSCCKNRSFITIMGNITHITTAASCYRFIILDFHFMFNQMLITAVRIPVLNTSILPFFGKLQLILQILLQK